MKKITVFILALLMIPLSGCGILNEENESSAAASQVQEKEQIKIITPKITRLNDKQFKYDHTLFSVKFSSDWKNTLLGEGNALGLTFKDYPKCWDMTNSVLNIGTYPYNSSELTLKENAHKIFDILNDTKQLKIYSEKAAKIGANKAYVIKSACYYNKIKMLCDITVIPCKSDYCVASMELYKGYIKKKIKPYNNKVLKAIKLKDAENAK